MIFLGGGLILSNQSAGRATGSLRLTGKHRVERVEMAGLIITAATMSRSPSRPLPASPARSGGCRAHEAKAQKRGKPQTVCAS